MVAIKSSHIVIPAKPTPSGRIGRSEFDQIQPWTHAPTIYIYKPNNNTINAPVIELMRNSLRQLLVHYYPVAGRLRWIEGGRLEIECNAMGAQLLEAESEATVDELGDFKPNEAIKELMPKIDYGSPIEELPLLVVQVTRFHCGGLSVGVAISHILADGMPAINFINSWAKLTRGEEHLDIIPFFDPTHVLGSREPLMAPRYDHEEFKSSPLIKGCTDDMAERNKETCAGVLKVTKDQIEKLKKMANDSPNPNRVRPYSRFEAFTGHVWRSACKARMGDSDQPTKARVAVDSRNRLKPPIPQEYFGNAVFPSLTPTCLYGELLSKPLEYAAGKIREAVEKMTEEYIRSALDFITSQEDVSPLRSSFHIVGYKGGRYLGNPNVSVTSWVHMPIYEADFGWGKPIYMGPGLVNADGKFFVMQSSVGDGSLNIAFRFQSAHMKAFQKFFYEDIQEVFHP